MRWGLLLKRGNWNLCNIRNHRETSRFQKLLINGLENAISTIAWLPYLRCCVPRNEIFRRLIRAEIVSLAIYRHIWRWWPRLWRQCGAGWTRTDPSQAPRCCGLLVGCMPSSPFEHPRTRNHRSILEQESRGQTVISVHWMHNLQSFAMSSWYELIHLHRRAYHDSTKRFYGSNQIVDDLLRRRGCLSCSECCRAAISWARNICESEVHASDYHFSSHQLTRVRKWIARRSWLRMDTMRVSPERRLGRREMRMETWWHNYCSSWKTEIAFKALKSRYIQTTLISSQAFCFIEMASRLLERPLTQ